MFGPPDTFITLFEWMPPLIVAPVPVQLIPEEQLVLAVKIAYLEPPLVLFATAFAVAAMSWMPTTPANAVGVDAVTCT